MRSEGKMIETLPVGFIWVSVSCEVFYFDPFM